VVFLDGFLVVFEVEDSVEVSVESLFGAFSVLASVFFVVLLVESAGAVSVFVDSEVVFFFVGLVALSLVELLVVEETDGFAVDVGGWTAGVAAGVATGLAVAVTAGVIVAAVAGVAVAATVALAAGVALGAVAFVEALVLVLVVVAGTVVVPLVEVTPTLKLGVTP
jgi:hypothetical protein